MAMFIIQLVESSSVRKAARLYECQVATVYRLRGRDAAMERAPGGTPQKVGKDGEWVGMARVFTDRLLMNLRDHRRLDGAPGGVAVVSL